MPDFQPLELNCDLGEGEPDHLTGALMGCVSSANIACGVHAGDLRTLDRCIELARRLDVHAGAHPGLRDAFGRGGSVVPTSEFPALLRHQLRCFADAAHAHGAAFHHIKLHGTLYHATETDEDLRETYLTVVQELFPCPIIYALAGGRTVEAARRLGLEAWDEAFADRGYLDDGSLVPRGEPGALITDAATVADRVRRLAAGRPILTRSGAELTLRARTVCVHADTAGSVALVQAVREALTAFSRGSGPAGI